MRAVRLRTEYLHEPLGLGIARPRFSWHCEGGVAQTAYRIVATRHGRTVWDSGIVGSSRMTQVAYDGAPLGSRDRVEWSVTLWDEKFSEGEASTSWFELGLLEAADWNAQWIAGDYPPKRHRRHPVDHFRREFTATGQVVSARLYITACGIYRARLNGQRAGAFELAPGATDYRHRLQYQTINVTDLITEHNTLEVELADGWYRGSLGAFGATNVFGRQTKLLCQLELTLADGSRQIIASGDGFSWSNDGPVRFADLKDGEVIDARLRPSHAGQARPAQPGPVPVASDNVEPRRQEVLTPTLITTPSGATVLDFGQNIAGFIGFSVEARAGQQVRVRLGEALDADGKFTQANFQLSKPVREFGKLAEILLMSGKQDKVRGELQPTPKQEVLVTCADGTTDYETAFAVFGFRYALVETDVEFTASDFRAVAVYSDMEATGDFECSNAEVNQFLSNTRWSMKGNFLDVPTDCPTRERLGWTGDAQVFFDTAAYLMDVAPFYRKWLRDLADNQRDSGKVDAVVPYNGFGLLYASSGSSVGWADAVVMVPHRFWRRYGDDQLLGEFYPMMRRFGQFLIGRTGHRKRRDAHANPHNTYVYEKGLHLGEWLEPEQFRDDVAGNPNVPRPEEATAYLHHTMKLLAEIAEHLGHADDAALFAEYAAGAKRAYNHLFVIDGTIDTDRQAKLVRPLALGLLDDEVREAVEERLVSAVESLGFTVGTGFLSTAFLLPVLTAAGHSDVAYRMLENERSPSWLAEVRAGATTVWEDWEGNESLNHYSPGAVCQWLFDTVAGIRVDGENHFTIVPTPGGTLTHASATYVSPYGTVASSWALDGQTTRFTAVVPANTTADIHLPDGTQQRVTAGRYEFTT